MLDRAAIVLPTIVNKLHLFGDGNGRTSRVLRMVIRDGITNADAGVDAIVSKDGFNKYDTTPSLPIEHAIIRKLREQHGTQGVQVDDDIDGFLVEDYLDEIGAMPGIDPRTVNSWQDTNNFNETARVFAMRHNLGSIGEDGIRHIALRGFLTELGANPDRQREFLDGYRELRKEKVVLWVDGLTGKVDLPLTDHHRWLASINRGRAEKQQEPLTDQDVNTASTLQKAYVESQAPLRPQS